jgi:hypothetical protein
VRQHFQVFIEPIPGAKLDDLEKALEQSLQQLSQARATVGSSHELYAAYCRWVSDSVARLSPLVRGDDLNRLVLTQRSWIIQSAAETAGLKGRLHTEFAEQTRFLEAVTTAVAAEAVRWRHAGKVVVPDTSFFLEHEHKLEEADVAEAIEARDEPIRIVVPMLVVDELDGAKRRHGNAGWRAAYTLGVLDRLLRSPGMATLREDDYGSLPSGGIPRGRVTLEVLTDPPGHSRLPIADDEIVARALAVQGRTGRVATLLTYDTGQALRARHVGLEVRKLTRARSERQSK